MNATDILARIEQNGGIMDAELETLIDSPPTRRALYSLFYKKEVAPFRNLILAMFRREMDFRRALDEDDVIDEEEGDEYCDGIYQCAFFIYRLGNPRDTYLLWEAKHINMDVGCMMDTEYLLGADVDETLAFLRSEGTDMANAIFKYLNGFRYDNEARAQWEEFQMNFFKSYDA